jgi:uncharacterized SAM-binding protein YcdF (DUF218 family)
MKKYDVVIVIPDEGYIVMIYKKAVGIYKHLIKKGKTPLVIVSGATRDPVMMKSYGIKKRLEKHFPIIPAEEQIRGMVSEGVSRDDIWHESQSGNTRENAMYTFELLGRFNLNAKKMFLFGSAEVILRKYLTFRKARDEFSSEIKIRPVPVFQWFPLKLTGARLIVAIEDLYKIWKYHKLGHL